MHIIYKCDQICAWRQCLWPKPLSNFLNVPHKSNPHVEASTSSTPVSTNMSNTTMQTMSVRGRESCRDQSLQIDASTPECPAFIWADDQSRGRDATCIWKTRWTILKRGTMFFMTCPKTSKPGGPPRKWVPVSYMIIDTHACGNLVGFMHIAPETPQSEMALHPNKSKRYFSNYRTACRKNNKSVSCSYQQHATTMEVENGFRIN